MPPEEQKLRDEAGRLHAQAEEIRTSAEDRYKKLTTEQRKDSSKVMTAEEEERFDKLLDDCEQKLNAASGSYVFLPW